MYIVLRKHFVLRIGIKSKVRYTVQNLSQIRTSWDAHGSKKGKMGMNFKATPSPSEAKINEWK